MFEKLMNNWIAFDGNDPPGGGTPPPPASPPPSGDGDKGKVTFTPEQQDVLNKMFAERGKQGAQAREAELLKELGFEKIDDAKAALAQFKKLKEGEKSDLQKQQEANAELQKQIEAANKLVEEAKAKERDRILRDAVIAEATQQNFRKDALADVWLVIDKTKIKINDAGKVVSVNGDKDVEGVAEIVKEIGKQKPHWLEAKTGAGGTPRPGGTKQPVGDKPKQTMGIRL